MGGTDSPEGVLKTKATRPRSVGTLGLAAALATLLKLRDASPDLPKLEGAEQRFKEGAGSPFRRILEAAGACDIEIQPAKPLDVPVALPTTSTETFLVKLTTTVFCPWAVVTMGRCFIFLSRSATTNSRSYQPELYSGGKLPPSAFAPAICNVEFAVKI